MDYFSENMLSYGLFEKIDVLIPGRYEFNNTRFFCIATIEQENNVDDDFTEDVSTFLMSDFKSTFDKYFS